MRGLRQFLRDENGATAIEYCLIAALVSVGIAASIGGLGSALADAWNNDIVPQMIDAFN